MRIDEASFVQQDQFLNNLHTGQNTNRVDQTGIYEHNDESSLEEGENDPVMELEDEDRPEHI